MRRSSPTAAKITSASAGRVTGIDTPMPSSGTMPTTMSVIWTPPSSMIFATLIASSSTGPRLSSNTEPDGLESCANAGTTNARASSISELQTYFAEQESIAGQLTRVVLEPIETWTMGPE